MAAQEIEIPKAHQDYASFREMYGTVEEPLDENQEPLSDPDEIAERARLIKYAQLSQYSFGFVCCKDCSHDFFLVFVLVLVYRSIFVLRKAFLQTECQLLDQLLMIEVD